MTYTLQWCVYPLCTLIPQYGAIDATKVRASMMVQAEKCGTVGCLGSFPLPSGLKIKLARSRYAVARDLKGVTAWELAKGKEHLRTVLAVGSTSTL